jgi:hypothetical protein
MPKLSAIASKSSRDIEKECDAQPSLSLFRGARPAGHDDSLTPRSCVTTRERRRPGGDDDTRVPVSSHVHSHGLTDPSRARSRSADNTNQMASFACRVRARMSRNSSRCAHREARRPSACSVERRLGPDVRA